MNKKGIISLIATTAALMTAQEALAICPVCTVAVGAGVGFSRWLGIDDSITGLWLGAFILSLSLWTIEWLERKNVKFFMERILVIIAYYALAIIPLYYAKIINNPVNFLCSCTSDKLILGIVEGSAAFFFGVKLYEFLKQRNEGHAHFPYEKVVMPVATMIIFTVIFYLIIK